LSLHRLFPFKDLHKPVGLHEIRRLIIFVEVSNLFLKTRQR
jgi:hypothetical protein